MFEWTVQTEISKDTCIWSRRSTSLSPGAKWHPGNPRWEVWVRKVVFTWTVLLLNPHKGTSWLLLAPSPALSSLYFSSSGAQQEATGPSVIPKFSPLHIRQGALLTVLSWALPSFGALGRWRLLCFMAPGVLWQVGMEPWKKSLRGLTRFKATQVGDWAGQCEAYVDKLERKLGRVLG